MLKKFISDFKINEQVDSCFILRKKNLKLTKFNKPYLDMTLADKTGKIEGRLWDDAENFNQAAETGDVVHVKGSIEKYRDERQLKVDFIEKADDRAFRFEDMVRVVENRDKILKNVKDMLKEIKNPWINKLAEEFLNDKEIMDLFIEGIGGKSWHNAYIGGLLEHTYEVMAISMNMHGLYPEADKDILIFGSFIHDIGKIHELDARNFEYTIEGGLVGHISIGHKLLMEKISKIKDFPKDLSLRIEHVILSHHGKYEQQSPVLPKTLEATIIYHADELVSQANAIKEIQKEQQEEGKVWSDFVVIKARKYYIKEAQDEDWKKTGGEEKPGDLFE